MDQAASRTDDNQVQLGGRRLNKDKVSGLWRFVTWAEAQGFQQVFESPAIEIAHLVSWQGRSLAADGGKAGDNQPDTVEPGCRIAAAEPERATDQLFCCCGKQARRAHVELVG